MGVKASKTYASIGVQVDWHSDVETPNTPIARVTEESKQVSFSARNPPNNIGVLVSWHPDLNTPVHAK